MEEIHVMSRAAPPPFDVESASRSAETIEEVRPRLCTGHPVRVEMATLPVHESGSLP